MLTMCICAGSLRLLYQQNITEEHYKNKTPKEIRDLVRDTCKQV